MLYNVQKFENDEYYDEQILNPDIVWYRHNMAGIYRSIGYVDSLGRFSMDHDLMIFLQSREKFQKENINSSSNNSNSNDNRRNSKNLDHKEVTANTNIIVSEDQNKPEFLKIEKVADYNTESNGYYSYLGLNRVFRKFVGVNNSSEEQEFAARMAKEFLNDLLLSQGIN